MQRKLRCLLVLMARCNETTIAEHYTKQLYEKGDSPKRGKQSPKVSGFRRISVRNVMNVEDSEWQVTVGVFRVFRIKKGYLQNSTKNYEYLMTSSYLEVESVSGVKADNCTPSGDRYDRTGHRENKCAGKYRVRCAGNVGSVGLASG
ncbi:uncharacterized protein HD556DRAFT_1309715 [Suillus plorans]|uniref:Uncharacterized protein n=1 Tax=Suillus plorans TaxID=116603 RepID=A0A9P7DGP6_9AGAM|nr:uncharacterized protein HD556DRAFT_1309715 [Suillus plorans]KAG1791919.1 hypothetical protein HD556DRAFT_1309715 [Suillus plorans]